MLRATVPNRVTALIGVRIMVVARRGASSLMRYMRQLINVTGMRKDGEGQAHLDPAIPSMAHSRGKFD